MVSRCLFLAMIGMVVAELEIRYIRVSGYPYSLVIKDGETKSVKANGVPIKVSLVGQNVLLTSWGEPSNLKYISGGCLPLDGASVYGSNVPPGQSCLCGYQGMFFLAGKEAKLIFNDSFPFSNNLLSEVLSPDTVNKAETLLREYQQSVATGAPRAGAFKAGASKAGASKAGGTADEVEEENDGETDDGSLLFIAALILLVLAGLYCISRPKTNDAT